MRSFELMQRNGVIATKRGIGFYICENAKQIVLNEQKKDFIENELPAFFKKLELYGMTIEDIKKYK